MYTFIIKVKNRILKINRNEYAKNGNQNTVNNKLKGFLTSKNDKEKECKPIVN